ncbi:uncharacterized protein METZ01_LOCUS114619 [marine metagenome]|uniref:Uncharacterized protein n=1 Tax=marine metagenome TaxID=408172 RepID=A0A381XAH3_9ZZZZ
MEESLDEKTITDPIGSLAPALPILLIPPTNIK